MDRIVGGAELAHPGATPERENRARGPGFRGREVAASRSPERTSFSGSPPLEGARAKRLDARAHLLHRRLHAVPVEGLHALLDDGLEALAIDRLDALPRLARLADQLIGDLTPDVAALGLGLLQLGAEAVTQRLNLAVPSLRITEGLDALLQRLDLLRPGLGVRPRLSGGANVLGDRGNGADGHVDGLQGLVGRLAAGGGAARGGLRCLFFSLTGH